jgi:hypothetical protein
MQKKMKVMKQANDFMEEPTLEEECKDLCTTLNTKPSAAIWELE